MKTNKLTKLEEHVKNHPADYQALIGLYKAKSKAYENQYKQRRIERLRLIADCKRKLHEE